MDFYGWLVKVTIIKNMNLLCYHIFREQNLVIDFLLQKNLQNNTLLAKHTPSEH